MINLMLLLLAAHALADYPLQGDFLAKGKNRLNPLPNIPWQWPMLWHSIIHAALVYIITGLWVLFLAEAIAHWVIDDMKCKGHLTFSQDQVMHILCKVIWATLAIAFGGYYA